MKKQLRKKIICSICFVFAMIMLFPMNIFAASKDNGTLTIKHPISDIKCRVYKVAEYSETGAYALEKPFDRFVNEVELLDKIERAPEDMTTNEWRVLGITLNTYLNEPYAYEKLEGVIKKGKVVFSDIERGLYLITVDSAEMNGVMYTSPAMLTTVPNLDELGQKNYQVELDYESKLGSTDIYDSYTVQKIWKSNTTATPVKCEITVDLYAEGTSVPYDTVKLNEANNWSYKWEKLPSKHVWSVKEREVPKNYKVIYSQNGSYFVIENVYYPPETPPEPPLPQTGQLWWPVPILITVGLLFILLGFHRRCAG